MSQPSEHDTLDHLLAQVSRLHHARAFALFETIGLYRGQPPLLGLLAEQEGLPHSELARRLGITPATISKMLDRMEKTGFVTCKPDPEDQRVSRVYLTERGHAVQGEMHHLFDTLQQETFAGFDEQECVLLRRFLLQLRANLLRVTSDKPPC
jgi:MarR family transcriptional regulator, organic hydroperoxide resistance regulator